ncbi:hypothetical protein [Brevundimonas nasdae]|uniref:hypothetical protein n=1 Tax=Brevundimonas nasdae TaxID=172043 RepID=UPI00301B3AA6
MAVSTLRLGKWFALLASVACLAACLEALPGGRLVDELAVPLPNDGKLLVSYRVRVSTPSFEASAINAYGGSHQKLWDDWGPAKRGNIYVTPDDRIVVIGSGGFVSMFEMHNGKAPRLLKEKLPPTEDGQDWKYLGAFVLSDGGNLVFARPSEMSEHIELLGGGGSPYRLAAQIP